MFTIAISAQMVGGCDPVSSLNGQVRSAAAARAPDAENGIAFARVTVRCPNQGHLESASVQANRTGHFVQDKISWDAYEDDCVLHVEHDGYEPVDVRVGDAKVGEAKQRVHVVIRLKPKTAP